MKGKRCVIGKIIFYITVTVVILLSVAVLLFMTVKIIFSDSEPMDDTKVYMLAGVFIILLFILYFFGNKIYDSYSDLLDYLDIEDIAEDLKKETKEDCLGKDFREELWNQINRRAEKAKIASLRSLDAKFTDLKDWIKVIMPSIK